MGRKKMSMNASSGIPVDKSLDLAFGTAREENNVRFLVVKIQDEKMVQTATHPLGSSAEADFSSIHGNEWVLISYVPDGSPVKLRMLYASSQALLKRELGMTYFSDEFHGSAPEDITWDLYSQHDRKKGAQDAPLTQAEMTRSAEVEMEFDPGHSREYVHSVAFPMSPAAVNALKSLSSKNVVQLRIDTEKETIELRDSFSASQIEDIRSKIPDQEPCFTFFRFVHQHEGSEQAPVIFIYSCTDGAKVKARMLYSTVKAAAIEAANGLGVSVEKKMEISEADDLSNSELLTELHPPAREITTKAAFSRPSRPGRGRARVTKK